MTRPEIVDTVWATRPSPPRRRYLWAALAGIGVHALLGVAMWRAGPSLESWAADVAIRVHQELVRVEAVDLEAHDPIAPEPEPEPEPAPVEEPPADVQPQPPSEPPPPSPPPATSAPRKPAPAPAPAEAAETITAPAEGPVDLSDDVIVTGSAKTFPGGATSAAGTSKTPVRGATSNDPGSHGPGPAAAAPKPTPPKKPRDRSRVARPTDGDWACPWPRAADALEIDEQSAVVRVHLDARGRVQSVEVTKDPGHGFGAAAAECARRARFSAARDAAGARIPAVTPPIRVRFTR